MKKLRKNISAPLGKKLTYIFENKPQKILKFFSIAEALANLSKDKSTQVGSLALDKNQNILCTGYNGFPRGVVDSEEKHLRPLKYSVTSHAEENLVSQAAGMGICLRGSTLLVTKLFPCTVCTRLILQSGIKCVISSKDKSDEKWDSEETISKTMFLEAGTVVLYYDKLTGEVTDLDGKSIYANRPNLFRKNDFSKSVGR